MTMIGVFLSFHIGGAIIMLLLALRGLQLSFSNDPSLGARFAIYLSYGLGFALVSGSLLSLVSTSGMSVLERCLNISLYMVLTFAIMSVLLFRAKERFHFAKHIVPVLPGLSLAVASVPFF